jgi:hypothetical protein
MSAYRTVVKRAVTVLVCALTVVTGGTATAGVAQAERLFNGTYTAVQKTPGQPDLVLLWNVMSACAIQSCIAHVADKFGGSNWIFDGARWSQLAVPPTSTCNGVAVPARNVHRTLTMRADGSLSGAVTSTVDCNGVTTDLTEPLTLTPA